MPESRLILGIGELLWDILPENPQPQGAPNSKPSPSKTLGGAPANFTVMAGRLGNHAAILSRIGRDDLGRSAIDHLNPMPVDTSAIQTDSVYETGRVTVSFVDNQPHYNIHQPAAWDSLELSDEWIQFAERADAICFGSLAQRSEQSRQTIQTILAQTTTECIRIFDVNLRTPFYTGEIVQESLELATVLKMNDEELPQILSLIDLPTASNTGKEQLRLGAERLLEEFPALELIAVTRGSCGSLLVRREEWNEHPGYPVETADLIGAGDAFTAALAHYMLRGADLEILNEAGNRWGSWVASQSGGMPVLTDVVRAEITAAIENLR